MAISLDPNLFEALSGRGQLYLAKHDYDRAIADLTRALAIKRGEPNAARAFLQAQHDRAQALQQAQDERTRQAILRTLSGRTQQPHANSPSSAASEAQDAPPQQAPRQSDKPPGPAYNPSDDLWREQQESAARENDRANRELYELNNRAEEEDREADRQRQMQDDQERWAREQQERERQEYQQRNGD